MNTTAEHGLHMIPSFIPWIPACLGTEPTWEWEVLVSLVQTEHNSVPAAGLGVMEAMELFGGESTWNQHFFPGGRKG